MARAHERAMYITKECKQPPEGRSHPLDVHHGRRKARGVGRRGEHRSGFTKGLRRGTSPAK
eukprot:12741690-Alexandrium_andersonii.AAC.1